MEALLQWKLIQNLLGSIDIWVEETGYFYKNGNHRIMYVNNNAILDNVIEEVSKVNQNHGIETKLEKGDE